MAAQDEFFRSECHPRSLSSLAYPPPPTQAPWHCPHPGGSGDLQGTPHTGSRLCVLCALLWLHPSLTPPPPARRLGTEHEGPEAAADHWEGGVWR